MNDNAREQRILRYKRWEFLITCNCIITAITVTITGSALMAYSYEYRGYFALGGEVMAIFIIGILLPIALYKLEKHLIKGM